MKKLKLIPLLLLFIFANSCKKDEVLEPNVDYLEKYVGTFLVKEETSHFYQGETKLLSGRDIAYISTSLQKTTNDKYYLYSKIINRTMFDYFDPSIPIDKRPRNTETTLDLYKRDYTVDKYEKRDYLYLGEFKDKEGNTNNLVIWEKDGKMYISASDFPNEIDKRIIYKQ